MNRIRLGVRLESLGLPLRRALVEAGKLGISGIQVDAVGDLSPNNLTQTGRREFRQLLRTHNLELTALGCPLRRTLDAAEDQQPRLEHVEKVMSLSFELGPRIVVVEAGQVPQDAKSDAARRMDESLLALGRHGDRTGTTLALETGQESGEVLAAYLGRFDSGGLGVNFDPANLLLHGFDPDQSARALRGRIVHAHAKDARAGRASRAAQEVPLGHGDIDWMTLLGVFEEIEYRGWMVVERDSGEDRVADVSAGVAFLRRFVG
jgi:L-ribulose-5-phosphate 3-epimerase